MLKPVLSDILPSIVKPKFIAQGTGEPRLRLVMFTGQSLSLGTTTQSENPIPDQEIPYQAYMFDTSRALGVLDVPLEGAHTAELVDFKEGNIHGYYSLGSGFVSYADSENPILHVSTGVGGIKLAELDLGGSMPSYQNEIGYLQAAKNLPRDSYIDTIVLVHGGADWKDLSSTYQEKMDTWKANQLAAVASVYPSHIPTFVFVQHGGERVLRGVHDAQYVKTLEGWGVCAGASYWLNRQYPNIDRVGAKERIHLNIDGYRYLGAMIRRAREVENFKPLHATSVDWAGKRVLHINCHVPNGGVLVKDISITQMPECSGLGIEVERTDNVLLAPSTVELSGTVIIATFDEDIEPNYRVRVGWTATDRAYTADNIEGEYPSALAMTNIRGSVPNSGVLGIPNWYDWLMQGYLPLEKDNPTMPVGYVLGGNLWGGESAQGKTCLGSKFTLSGGMITRVRDGIELAPVAIGSVVAGTSGTRWAFSVMEGKRYRVSGMATITSDRSELWISFGATNLVLKTGQDGAFAMQGVATLDGYLSIKVINKNQDSVIEDIEIREVLNPVADAWDDAVNPVFTDTIIYDGMEGRFKDKGVGAGGVLEHTDYRVRMDAVEDSGHIRLFVGKAVIYIDTGPIDVVVNSGGSTALKFQNIYSPAVATMSSISVVPEAS